MILCFLLYLAVVLRRCLVRTGAGRAGEEGRVGEEGREAASQTCQALLEPAGQARPEIGGKRLFLISSHLYTHLSCICLCFYQCHTHLSLSLSLSFKI